MTWRSAQADRAKNRAVGDGGDAPGKVIGAWDAYAVDVGTGLYSHVEESLPQLL